MKKQNLKIRLWANVLKTNPWIVLKISVTWFFLLPWFLASLVTGSFKASRWSKAKAVRNFISQNPRVFPDIDPESVRIEALSGGVSNSNHLWKCRTTEGKEVIYFAKVFVPVGTFWAQNLSRVSPFPRIDGPNATTHARFTADKDGRAFLAGHGIAVPSLVASEEAEHVMVTEYVEGKNVDRVLKDIAKSEKISVEEESILRECGESLGKIHTLGYSLVDTQPVNCIWSPQEKRVYFTDLEFCTRKDKQLWDITFFYTFLGIRLSEPLKSKVQKLFLEAYQKESKVSLEGMGIIQARIEGYIPIFKTVLDIRQFKPDELFTELVS